MAVSSLNLIEPFNETNFLKNADSFEFGLNSDPEELLASSHLCYFSIFTLNNAINCNEALSLFSSDVVLCWQYQPRMPDIPGPGLECTCSGPRTDNNRYPIASGHIGLEAAQ